MKIYISCDLEGVACVVRPEHTTTTGLDYHQARRLMTAEVNAAIEGAFAAGATEILVADSHHKGLNILPEELDERADLIMGTTRPHAMMAGVDAGFDASFLVGYHAKPGTANAVIAHNFHSRLRQMTLNGIEVGELGFNSSLAGLYGVPVALVTGDLTTAQEAQELLSGVTTVVVKEGMGAYAARNRHPKVSRKLIFQGAQKALTNFKAKPFVVAQPTVLGLTVTTASTADQLEKIPNLKRIGSMTFESEPLPLREVADIFLLATELVDNVPFI